MSIPKEAIKELNLEQLKLKKAAMVIRALNHKLRQEILLIIHKAGIVSVSEIYERLLLEQSITSQHLAILRKAGFVTSERDGKKVFYSVNYKRLKQVQESIENGLI